MNKKLCNEIKSRIEEAINIFVPRVCCMCGEELRSFENNFCTECFASLPFTQFWKFKDNPAKELFRGKIPVEGAVPLLVYKGAVRDVMHDFKYHSAAGIGEELGKMLGEVIATSPFMQEPIEEGITIVPIPLHPRKKRKRGYNQSEIIARGIKKGIEQTLREKDLEKGLEKDIEKDLKKNLKKELEKALKIEIQPNLLKRTKFTGTQTSLGKLQRFRNIQSAFAVNEKEMKKFCSKKKRAKSTFC